MRASEFVKEVTDPKEPPKPGSKEYNASKETFAKRVGNFIQKYNNSQYNQSQNDPTQYKRMSGDEIYNDFMEKFKAYLQQQGAGYIVPRDFPLVLDQISNKPNIIPVNKTEPEANTAQAQSAPSFDKDAFQKRAASANANKAKARRTKESVDEASDLNPSQDAANTQNYNYLSWGNNVGSIVRNNDDGYWHVILHPNTVDKMAQVLTDRFYANRKLATIDKDTWQQISGQTAASSSKSSATIGYSPQQQALKKMVGVDPQSPQFAQALSNIVADRPELEKFKQSLNKYFPPTAKK
jgi:hypothetical protein